MTKIKLSIDKGTDIFLHRTKVENLFISEYLPIISPSPELSISSTADISIISFSGRLLLIISSIAVLTATAL